MLYVIPYVNLIPTYISPDSDHSLMRIQKLQCGNPWLYNLNLCTLNYKILSELSHLANIQYYFSSVWDLNTPASLLNYYPIFFFSVISLCIKCSMDPLRAKVNKETFQLYSLLFSLLCNQMFIWTMIRNSITVNPLISSPPLNREV